ncbi:MAG: DUF3618 domain-containing protein [Solirubrobacterales bacterium]|nr:DUF3618 domain-containing protein [Solirubrobacterales bacterium]MBV9944723.1 DUF3618 domain-containing protein [Solirubrobacterales bacterium]
MTGSSDAAVTGSGDPEEIRREIEATREELGDTVAALAAKADVKSQAKQKFQDTKAAVVGKKDELAGKAKQASPQTASTAATSASQKARENPVPVTAAGAFAFGFLAGWVMRR